jgi:hypothetical protein
LSEALKARYSIAQCIAPCHYPNLLSLAIVAFCPERAMDISRWWNHRNQAPTTRTPAGVLDRTLNDKVFHHRVSLLRPSRGAKAITTLFPVVPPPANIHCASSAKRKDLGNDKASHWVKVRQGCQR